MLKYQHYRYAEWSGGLVAGMIAIVTIGSMLQVLRHRGLEPSPLLLMLCALLAAGAVALAWRYAGLLWRWWSHPGYGA